MKKKVTYKLEQTKSIIVEVETEEQEQKIKEFNRDFERIDRQNRRIADFGTVVETCSKTAADCPCRVFPYIERTGQGFRLAMGGLFSFPLKIHFKGRQLPAGRGFFKISFALVIRATGFWQPARQRIFPFTPHTTAL